MLRFLRLLRLAFWRAFQHDAFSIAKASAYSSILTFFPTLLVVGSVLATWRKGAPYMREITYALSRILPAGSNTAMSYLRGAAQRPVGLLITASLITLWTASGVMISWMEGFRRCYELPKVWGLVKERLISFLLVIFALLPMTFATLLVALGSKVETNILFYTAREYSPIILVMWGSIRWLIATLTSIAVIALIYHNAVPRTQPWHSVIPGATLATGMWFSATLAFGFYLRHYADYSIIYGSLGAAIALLVWMYMVSLVVLVGAEFNAMLFPRTMLGKELTAVANPKGG
ncbi:MAG TPA: YihY/virulence factor BrkB family protein [Candidatus Dormibacteraeota bacterium]|jgi:membrane protein|nr:YihY/virulence factor BrkB family protein [Candidatus Dormibacteraeota bacterium]